MHVLAFGLQGWNNYLWRRIEFKKANRRLQGIETGHDDLVLTIGTKPSKFLEHLFVSNQDGKLANRLSAVETTAGEQVVEGFAPDHPWGMTVSKEHKISRAGDESCDLVEINRVKLEIH